MSRLNTEKARCAGYSRRRRGRSQSRPRGAPTEPAQIRPSRDRNERSLSPVRRVHADREREYDQERGQPLLSSDMPHLKPDHPQLDREVLIQRRLEEELDLVRSDPSWRNHGFAIIGWIRHRACDWKDTVGALERAEPDDPTGVLQEVDRRTGHLQYVVPITLHPNRSMHVGWDVRLSADDNWSGRSILMATIKKNADIGLRTALHMVKNNLSAQRARF